MFSQFKKSYFHAFAEAFFTSPVGQLLTIISTGSLIIFVLYIVVGGIYFLFRCISAMNAHLISVGILQNITDQNNGDLWAAIEIWLVVLLIAIIVIARDTYAHMTRQMLNYELEMIHINR